MLVDLRKSILKVLAYFDLFNYPVSKEEILSFLEQPVSREALFDALGELQANKNIFLYRSFYMIQDNEALVDRRVAGSLRAQPLLQTGNRISHFLYQMPYVRAISISGSLSKNFAGEDADIDYFIITKANRLWLARTLMHIIKKLSFLTGKQHWYCMNYYIDEEALEIEEKNIFTAIELITLLPVRGNGILHEFYDRNDWTAGYYPNYGQQISPVATSARETKFKRAAEYLLNGKLGDWLDDYFMHVTTRRWNKKEAAEKRSAKGTRMSLHTGKHFSKPNPVYFQQQILSSYQDKLQKLSLKCNMQVV
jgi:hypothetical protein